MKIIIFSKDRAAQLSILMKSLVNNVSTETMHDLTIIVIYKASNPNFLMGYDKLRSEYSGYVRTIHWVYESNSSFYYDTLRAINTKQDLHPFTMFLVDDDYIHGDISLKTPELNLLRAHPDQYLAVSLRLSPKRNFCYPLQRTQMLPNFEKVGEDEVLTWNWFNADGDFGYPMSLDGHIFSTNVIKHIVERLPTMRITNPNTLEDLLAQASRGFRVPGKMICYKEAKLTGFPLNRVQDQYQNRFEAEQNYTIEELNELFLINHEWNMDMLTQEANNAISAHHPLHLKD